MNDPNTPQPQGRPARSCGRTLAPIKIPSMYLRRPQDLCEPGPGAPVLTSREYMKKGAHYGALLNRQHGSIEWPKGKVRTLSQNKLIPIPTICPSLSLMGYHL